MKDKKGINFIWVIIAVVIGSRLFKEFDFKNLKFANPALDVIYLLGFSISIYFILKKSQNKKSD